MSIKKLKNLKEVINQKKMKRLQSFPVTNQKSKKNKRHSARIIIQYNNYLRASHLEKKDESCRKKSFFSLKKSSCKKCQHYKKRLIKAKREQFETAFNEELILFINNDFLFKYFFEFCQNINCDENVMFCREIRNFDSLNDNSKLKKANDIYKKYIKKKSPHELNISDKSRDLIKIFIDSNNIVDGLFRGIQHKILYLIGNGPFIHFKKDDKDTYLTLLSIAKFSM